MGVTMCEECMEVAFEGETPVDVAKSIVGPVSDDEASRILWEQTCFPFGRAQDWIKHLMEFRMYGWRELL